MIPVVLYGSAIWDKLKSYNLLHLDNQDEGVNAQSIGSRVLQYGILHKRVRIEYIRRVGKLTPGTWRILVSLNKENILLKTIPMS